MYNFYEVQEQMSRLLSEKGVEHYHYIDIGTHANTFYLPLFVDSIQYVQERMYRTDTSADVLGGTAKVTEGTDAIAVDYELNVSGDVQNYLNHIENSEYTEDTNPDLQIPVQITVTQDGVRVADMTNLLCGEFGCESERQCGDPRRRSGSDKGLYSGSICVCIGKYQITAECQHGSRSAGRSHGSGSAW